MYISIVNPSDLIERVRKDLPSRNQVMTELYTNRDLRINCSKFILSKGGTPQDVESIFGDVIINFVKNCYRPDFSIHSSLENYLFGVTRNLWYRTIRERMSKTSSESLPERIDSEDPEILLVSSEKKLHLRRIVQKLDEKCRQVLTLWSQDMKMKMIAEEMNYSSPEVVRKKKHFCLKKLIKLVHDHPGYLESLKDND